MTEQTQPDPTGTVISADDQRAIAFTDMARPKAHTEGLDLLANWPPDDDQ